MKDSKAEGLWDLHELGKVLYNGAALFNMHYLLSIESDNCNISVTHKKKPT